MCRLYGNQPIMRRQQTNLQVSNFMSVNPCRQYVAITHVYQMHL